MRQEESFADYDTGFRRGIFDKANGRKILTETELLAYGDIFGGGYRDGLNSTDAYFPQPPTALESLWIDCYAALACDGETTIGGNSANPITVLRTLEFLAEEKLLTLPEKPSREEIEAYASENWGVDPEDLMEV